MMTYDKYFRSQPIPLTLRIKIELKQINDHSDIPDLREQLVDPCLVLQNRRLLQLTHLGELVLVELVLFVELEYYP